MASASWQPVAISATSSSKGCCQSGTRGSGFLSRRRPGVTDVDAIEYRDDVANLNGSAGFHAYHVSAGATGINYYGCKASYNAQTSAHHGFSAYYANNIHYHGVEAAFTNIDPATGLPNAYIANGDEGHGIAFDEYSGSSSVEHSYSHGNGGAGSCSRMRAPTIPPRITLSRTTVRWGWLSTAGEAARAMSR